MSDLIFNGDVNEGPVSDLTVPTEPHDLRLTKAMAAVGWLLQKHGHEIGLCFADYQSGVHGPRVGIQFDEFHRSFSFNLEPKPDEDAVEDDE